MEQPFTGPARRIAAGAAASRTMHAGGPRSQWLWASGPRKMLQENDGLGGTISCFSKLSNNSNRFCQQFLLNVARDPGVQWFYRQNMGFLEMFFNVVEDVEDDEDDDDDDDDDHDPVG